MKKYLWMSSAAVVIGALGVNIYNNQRETTTQIYWQWSGMACFPEFFFKCDFRSFFYQLLLTRPWQWEILPKMTDIFYFILLVTLIYFLVKPIALRKAKIVHNFGLFWVQKGKKWFLTI